MSKLNKILIAIVVILLVVFPFAYYFCINARIGHNSKMILTAVPYSNMTLQPGTRIAANMVSEMNVPTSSLKGDYYLALEDIVGKCVKDNTRIVEGSIFYKDLLTKCSNDVRE